jgi:peptide deformylase
MRLYNYGTKNLRKVARNINPESFPYMDFKKSMESNVKRGYVNYITLPQMGETRRGFTAELSKGVKTFMNPRLKYGSGKIISKEKCHSLPGVETEVERYSEVTITYVVPDEFGGLSSKREKYSGKDACIIQHCYDHLDGVFMIDYKDEKYTKDISDKLNEISLSKERPVSVGSGSGSIPKKKSRYGNTRATTTINRAFMTYSDNPLNEINQENDIQDDRPANEPENGNIDSGDGNIDSGDGNNDNGDSIDNIFTETNVQQFTEKLIRFYKTNRQEPTERNNNEGEGEDL